MDRPDLWPMRRRPAHRPVKISEGQIPNGSLVLDYWGRGVNPHTCAVYLNMKEDY